MNEDRKAGEGVGCTGIGEHQCRWEEVREEESGRRGTQVKAREEGQRMQDSGCHTLAVSQSLGKLFKTHIAGQSP